jgi:hypothetical protein
LLYPAIYLYSVSRNRNIIHTGKLLLPFILLTAFVTLNALGINIYASRAADTNEIGLEYLKAGIGGYHFIYGMVILVVILVESLYLKRELKKIIRAFILLLIALLAIVITLSNFFTAVLLMLIGVGTVVLLNSSGKMRIFIILCLLVFLFFGKQITEALIVAVQNFYSDGRIFNVFSQVKGGSLLTAIWGEFVSDRLPVIVESFEAIAKNPFLGIAPFEIEIFGDFDVGYGQHSTFFDTFALFGMPIGLIYNYLLFRPFFVRRRLKGDKAKKTIPLLVVYFLLMIFNNLTASVSCFTFLIGLPLVDMNYEAGKIRVNGIKKVEI